MSAKVKESEDALLGSVQPFSVVTQGASSRPDLSDLLIQYLKELQVEYVFGVPGGAIAPLYDALGRRRNNGPKAIVSRHESGGAFMADGYSRETGKIGVCCATTGPGTTNMITGVASSYASRVPLLVITAQTNLPTFGRGAFQESSYDAINTVDMFQHCTLYNTLVTHPGQFESKLASALMVAMRDKGPVHLSIPMDIFRHPVEKIQFPHFEKLLETPKLIDFEGVNKLCKEILKNPRIVLLLGGGSTEAVPEILDFAESMRAPFVTTPQGKCCVDPYHKRNYGVFGFAGHYSARKLLSDESVGLVLAIGSNLGEWATNGWDSDVLLNNKLVVINASSDSFSRSPMARQHVYGNLKSMFEFFASRARTAREVGRLSIEDWADSILESEYQKENDERPDFVRNTERHRCSPRQILVEGAKKYRREENTRLGEKVVKPQRLMCELNQRFPPDTRFLADTGNSFAWTTHYLFHASKYGAYRISMEFGSMGWAIGAAVGTALGTVKRRPVVCITGDGSFLMSGQELTVAVQEKLTVIFVILNDHGLGMVRHGQRMTGAESIAHEISPVDFAAMARAMGAKAHSIHTVEDFDAINFQNICTRSEPTLLDVYIDADEIPPMGMRAKGLLDVSQESLN
ncbi:MAG: thiamine pyrophosphate-binding protein [Pseudomonadota bacterium]